MMQQGQQPPAAVHYGALGAGAGVPPGPVVSQPATYVLPAGLWPQQQALQAPANVDDDAEMDLDFDMAVSRRSPPEIAKISQFFNKCYRVGFTAMVTVMLCLTVIVAPFVGMFAGTMWVLVRVFVNPLVEPLAHLFRIMCGRGGTAQMYETRLQIQYLQAQLLQANRAAAAAQTAQAAAAAQQVPV